MPLKKELKEAAEEKVKAPGLSMKAAPRGKLKAYHVRFHEGDWKILKEHFEDQGITISAGLRQIVRSYMKKEGL